MRMVLKVMMAALSVLSLVACSDTDFASGGASSPSQKTEKPPVQESSDATPQAVEVKNAEVKSETQTVDMLCKEAMNGNFDQVISISQNQEVEIKEGAVVFLDASGLANFDLNAGDVASIRGLCIEATGQAEIRIDTSLVVAEMYYYARGQAIGEISFGSTGSLAKLQTDLAGQADLTISGDLIDCGKLVSETAGNGKVECTGK